MSHPTHRPSDPSRTWDCPFAAAAARSLPPPPLTACRRHPPNTESSAMGPMLFHAVLDACRHPENIHRVNAVARYRFASEQNDIEDLVQALAPEAELISPLSGRMVFGGREDLRILLGAVYGITRICADARAEAGSTSRGVGAGAAKGGTGRSGSGSLWSRPRPSPLTEVGGSSWAFEVQKGLGKSG